MNYKSLDSFSKIISGGTPDRKKPEYFDGNIPWIKTGDLKNKYIVNSPEKIAELGLNNSSAKILPVNTVLVAMYGATIGACSILNIEAATNQACAAFLPSDKINHEFLYYYIKSIRKQLIKKGQGGGQPNISLKILKKIKIPVLDISDQIRIATILSKAEALIKQRKENIDLLDEFLRNTFLKLYFKNLNNCKKYSLDNLKSRGNETFSNGPFGSDLLTSELTDNGVPVIYIRDIRNGNFEWKSNVYVNQQKASTLNKCIVQGEDLLISKVGDPPGISCVYPKNHPQSIMTQDVIRIRLNKELANPYWIKFLLNSEVGQQIIRKITISGTRSRFSLTDFKKLTINIPSINHQIEFFKIVDRTENLKQQFKSSLFDLEELYKSLSHKVFNDESIDLSRIQIETIEQSQTPVEPIITKLENNVKPVEKAIKENPEKSKWETIKSFGKGENIPFSTIEGDAVIRLVFSKKTHGFTFHEFDEFLKKEGFVYNYEKIKDFIFSKLESKELVQYYANKEWIANNYNPQISPLQDDFAGIDGNIWYVPQQSRS